MIMVLGVSFMSTFGRVGVDIKVVPDSAHSWPSCSNACSYQRMRASTTSRVMTPLST